MYLAGCCIYVSFNISEAEYKSISNSKSDNMMYVCAKCQPMVGITLRLFNEVRMKQAAMGDMIMTVESTIEKISRTSIQTETDVATVKETADQMNENTGSVENTTTVIHLKLDDMKDFENETERRRTHIIYTRYKRG